MRTTLLFILLCSLAPFVESGGQIKGCGKQFKCFGPSMCIDSSITTVVGSKVVEVKAEATEPNCPAVIKFHQYHDYWSFVSIESFDVGLKTIIFRQNNHKNEQKSSISCEKSDVPPDSNKVEGKLIDDVIHTETNVPDDKPISCTFEIKLDLKGKIFKDHKPLDSVVMVIGTETTEKDDIILQNIRQCDPSDFKFEQDREPTEVYDKIMYNAGEYFCKDEKFGIQYRPAKDKNYKPLTADVDCAAYEYKLNNDYLTSNDWIYIRCVAQAHFFCDYDVVTKQGERQLERVRPVKKIDQKSSLKCPDGFPYLFIDRLRPLMNPKIECLNYGGSQFWTVNTNLTYLTSKGPTTYCSKTVDCFLLYRIPSKSVTKGYVGDDFLPHCFENGVMHVNEKEVDEKDIICDKSVGKYKYKDAEGQKDVTDATKFECVYPSLPDHEQNEKNQQALQTGVSLVVGGCVGAVVIAAIVGVLVGRAVARKHKKKAEKATTEGYFKYLMNTAERADAKKHGPAGSSSSKTSELMNWNKLHMHTQYANQSRLTEVPIVPKQTAIDPKPDTKKGEQDIPRLAALTMCDRKGKLAKKVRKCDPLLAKEKHRYTKRTTTAVTASKKRKEKMAKPAGTPLSK